MGPDRQSGDRSLGTLSVVAPVHNEREVLPEFHRRIGEALSGIDYELVLVNDGSDDGTAELLEVIAAADPRVRVITCRATSATRRRSRPASSMPAATSS